jgi:uncharacterized membrane protein YcjF (UPF0283 family)
MHDLIFWYTGWVVWAAIAVIVAIGVIIGAVVVIAKSYHLSKEWLGLKLLYSRISKNEISRLRDILAPVPENINVDALMAYAVKLRERAPGELNQPLFEDEDDTKHTMTVASIFGHYDGKKPFSHWLRDVLDQIQELRSDATNRVYRDAKHAAYLRSLLDCDGGTLVSKFDGDIINDIAKRLTPKDEDPNVIKLEPEKTDA